ncbi:MAG TPA: hypothetical protein VJI33_00680 [Candidatus Paceibacterota bacterium]
MGKETLSDFTKGDQVTLQCYNYGCGGVQLGAQLGIEGPVFPSFTGAGRFKFEPGTNARSFVIVAKVTCPVCKTSFYKAIMFMNGHYPKPTIFGYDPKSD